MSQRKCDDINSNVIFYLRTIHLNINQETMNEKMRNISFLHPHLWFLFQFMLKSIKLNRKKLFHSSNSFPLFRHIGKRKFFCEKHFLWGVCSHLSSSLWCVVLISLSFLILHILLIFLVYIVWVKTEIFYDFALLKFLFLW